MYGNQFFQLGAQYRVGTHRPGTAHSGHFFDIGTVVTCKEVIIAPDRNLRVSKGRLRITKDFRRSSMVGLFVDSKGIEQVLSTGDVWRL